MTLGKLVWQLRRTVKGDPYLFLYMESEWEAFLKRIRSKVGVIPPESSVLDPKKFPELYGLGYVVKAHVDGRRLWLAHSYTDGKEVGEDTLLGSAKEKLVAHCVRLAIQGIIK